MFPVRLFAASISGGVLSALLMPQMPLARQLPSMLSLGLALLVIPFAIGFVTRRRGWLAALGANVLGVALWIALYLRPSPPWAPSDNWSPTTWALFVGGQLLPWVVVASLLGAAGSWLAGRATRPRVNRTPQT